MHSMQEYFDKLEKETKEVYKLAETARKKGIDPVDYVEIPLARNMAERVEGLISAIAPQIKGSGIAERIIELEHQFGILDWRVALTIALETAQQKFCKFDEKKTAMEVGIRVGFAYITVGVVASPLEGFVELKLKKRKDGQKYFCLMYSGPVRSAGGTGSSVSVIIADYIRVKMGYEPYDPTKDEINRTVTEINDYHEKVTNLQYLPSEEEIRFLAENLPVQIDGDPSEKYEVSNYKDQERIETNRIRNGLCLVMAECLAQKAAKVHKQLTKWGSDFGLSHWNFLEKFIRIQEKIKAKGKVTEAKILPDYTYIKDIVGGRPVLTHPLRHGGFRLRYGRTRTSGFSADALHPATLVVLKSYIAIGTQLKTERPGKGTTVSICDRIEGPVVKLNNGNVIYFDNASEAEKYVKDIEEILYLGDILINYGDFFNRAHRLVPCGFNEDWYQLIIEKAGIKKDAYHMAAEEAIGISAESNVPLHPRYTFHWRAINKEQLIILLGWFKNAVIEGEKVILPFVGDVSAYVEGRDPKRVLELVGVPHSVAGEEYVIIEGDCAKAICANLGLPSDDLGMLIQNITNSSETDTLKLVNLASGIEIYDKSGTFIGARMGRPEKAKMRKMTGSPHVLFPVGSEGGRMRSFQAALEKGKVTAEFMLFYCDKCNAETIDNICGKCGDKLKATFFCLKCNAIQTSEMCEQHGKVGAYNRKSIDISEHYGRAIKMLKITHKPELVKGVRGTSNKAHFPENIAKGILRAAYNVYVNKDGTIRYDMTEQALTHFKPKEIGTPIDKLKLLGYVSDMYGNDLKDENQIIELKCQDVVLPACKEADEDGADEVLFRSAQFIDDMLEKLYGVERFYNLKSKADIVGHLVVGLSPHTSAGVVARIIGFSKTQGFLAHPLYHSLLRRDCLAYDTYFPVYENGKWGIHKIGDYVEKLKPDKNVDFFGTMAKKVRNIKTLVSQSYSKPRDVIDFTKHTKSSLIKIKTQCGREIKVTLNHKFYVRDNEAILLKEAKDLEKNDLLIVPYVAHIPENDTKFLNLLEIFENKSNLMVRAVNRKLLKLITNKNILRKELKIPKYALDNYIARDSYPLSLLKQILSYYGKDISWLTDDFKIGISRDNVSLPIKIPLNKEFLNIIGLYVAEGCARKVTSEKGFYQINFSASELEIRSRIIRYMKSLFKLKPSFISNKDIVFSSHLLYDLFVLYLKAGNNAHNKRVPSLFLDLPLNKLSCFINGYLDGDGSVSLSDFRVVCDTVSEGLIQDLIFVFSRYKIFIKLYRYTSQPGPQVRAFYIRKEREIPYFTLTKLIIPADFVHRFNDNIGFTLKRKNKILRQLIKKRKVHHGMKIKFDDLYVYSKVKEITKLGEEVTYSLNTGNSNLLANNILVSNCDGDEAAIMLLTDALINFSRQYLPGHRGAVQDAPLVLTSKIIPAEVDDMVFDMDVAERYPLEFYEAAQQFKFPWDIKIEQLKHNLGTEKQYSGYRFTHDTDDFNNGIRYSAYKSIPTMREKVLGQMELAEKIRAVDEVDVARLVIERHFIRDIKGNLRKFSLQQFRCVACNEKYRRPPLNGKCRCNGRIIFTISEGSITKYLEPSLQLIDKYDLPAYLKQTVELTKAKIEGIFGKETEKQSALKQWF